jgi:hypothetical protein
MEVGPGNLARCVELGLDLHWAALVLLDFKLYQELFRRLKAARAIYEGICKSKWALFVNKQISLEVYMEVRECANKEFNEHVGKHLAEMFP